MQRKVFKPVGVFIEPLMQVLVYPTQYQLMYSLGRFQEYYENPDLAGRAFSREDLQRWQPDYYIQWCGCNFPWRVAREISNRRNQFCLDVHEMAALNVMIPGRYIVGTHLGRGEEMVSVLDHERMHATFDGDEKYRAQLKKLADKEADFTAAVYAALATIGYGMNVWLDEYQAWAVSGDWEEKLGMPRPKTLLVGCAQAMAATINKE